MSRYIGVNSVNDIIKSGVSTDTDADQEYVCELINSAPSIEIVRCAECIWQDKDNHGEAYCTYAKGLADINGDSFCSWGERKESE